MKINLCILLLLWSHLIAICMAGCAITPNNNGNVTIPKGALFLAISDDWTSIGDRAFENCLALQSVTIGDSVTSIGSSAFQSCIKLQSVTIGDSVTSIGVCIFQLQYIGVHNYT